MYEIGKNIRKNWGKSSNSIKITLKSNNSIMFRKYFVTKECVLIYKIKKIYM